MKKLIFLFVTTLFVYSQTRADEGMWMPSLLHKKQADMQSKGLKISADDIYSETQPSLKDAVVRFGRGCTGSFISGEGLVFTNHHCGYGQIQSHSTVENDYLQYGFWAKSFGEELPCPGLTVSRVIQTIDVTEAVLSGTTAEMGETEAAKIRDENIRRLTTEAKKETGYEAEVRAFYTGNQYYMYLNEVFQDVRLVGAPPSNIGKFGGDTDNWMWPRHTGDFALFRVYVDKDNKPARYAETNVPYQPKTHFKISLKGIEQDDFTFVFGYPGRTNEYLTSHAIRQKVDIENPLSIAARTKRLDIIKAAMDQDPHTRIQYSAKAANIANAWKRWQGENRGIKRMDGIAQKEAYEKTFQQWANSYNNGQYRDLLPQLKAAYNELEPLLIQSVYFNEYLLAPEIMRFVQQFEQLVTLSNNDTSTPAAFDELLNQLKNRVAPFFKDFDLDVDKKLFKTLQFAKIEGLNEPFIGLTDRDKDSDKYVDGMYDKSIFTSEAKLNAALNKVNRSNATDILFNRDGMLQYASLVYSKYNSTVAPQLRTQNATIDLLQRTYMKAQMEMESDRSFYPDANSTLRVAYGKIDPYSPADAVTYNYYTTLSGLIAKEDPNIFDYVVEDKLKNLYNTKDFGAYANRKGEMPIAFVASNHTSGGNSGSPVLNANGEIIGINFDRCWEGTMSDLMYDPTQCRNISMDVRFLMFMIDRYAGADYLLREIEVVK